MPDKKYSEQFLEAKINSIAGEDWSANDLEYLELKYAKIYGMFCFLEGKWVYAYSMEKERIEKELHTLAREHGLIN